MKDLIARLPEIITAAAASPRGVISLMVIAAAVITFLFFRRSAEIWKFASLVLLFLGFAGFVFTVYRESQTKISAADGSGKMLPSASVVPVDSTLGISLERWIEQAEKARSAKTVSGGSPLPTDLIEARSVFMMAWRQASLPAKKLLDPVRTVKGLGYLTRLYRLEENDSSSKPNAMSWANEAIHFSEEIQNPTLLTDALVDKAAIYLDLAQLEHTDKANFEQNAKAGDALMTRAFQTASQEQRVEVLRITSRFYYDLARPHSFRLSEAWDNNYLLLAYQKMSEAEKLDPASLKNKNQLARVVIKVSKNPPQDRDPEWTIKLRNAKDSFKQAWEVNKDKLRTIDDRLSPLDVLGVITLETAAREWGEAAIGRRRLIAPKLLAELETDSIGPLREAAALLENSELRRSHDFDVHFDIARSLALKTGILNLVSPNKAQAVLLEAKRNLETAREAARTSQLEAALIDFDREIAFSFLVAKQRRPLTRLMSVTP